MELVQDVQMATAPLSPAQAEALLRRLTLWPLLAGTRGQAPLDVAAVANALSRLSWLAADLGPRLRDIEMNPLIVREAGHGAVAADGRGTIGAAP